jgi:hypothetical protein
MAAFKSPDDESAHHPGPWQIVHGAGQVETARVQIVIEPCATLLMSDRAESLRLISGVIRLLSNAPSFISAVSDRPLTRDSARDAATHLSALEPVPAWPSRIVTINDAMHAMLLLLLRPASSLFKDEDVYRAFLLADGIWWLPSRAAQMISIWTAAEILMRPAGRSKGKGLASAIRKYIGRNASDGDRTYNEVLELYEMRGGATHAGRSLAIKDVERSYLIVRNILIRAIHERQRPPLLDAMTTVWHEGS